MFTIPGKWVVKMALFYPHESIETWSGERSAELVSTSETRNPKPETRNPKPETDSNPTFGWLSGSELNPSVFVNLTMFRRKPSPRRASSGLHRWALTLQDVRGQRATVAAGEIPCGRLWSRTPQSMPSIWWLFWNFLKLLLGLWTKYLITFKKPD